MSFKFLNRVARERLGEVMFQQSPEGGDRASRTLTGVKQSRGEKPVLGGRRMSGE